MYHILFNFKTLIEKALLLYQTWIKWAVSKGTSTYMHVEVALLYLLFDLNTVKPLYLTLLYSTESSDEQTPALLLLARYLIRNHVLSLTTLPYVTTLPTSYLP